MSILRRCILSVGCVLLLVARSAGARAQIVLDDILFVASRPVAESKVDTLLDLARAFGLGFTEAAAAMEREEMGRFSEESVRGLEDIVSERSSFSEAEIDWAVVNRALHERRGIPIQISR